MNNSKLFIFSFYLLVIVKGSSDVSPNDKKSSSASTSEEEALLHDKSLTTNKCGEGKTDEKITDGNGLFTENIEGCNISKDLEDNLKGSMKTIFKNYTYICRKVINFCDFGYSALNNKDVQNFARRGSFDSCQCKRNLKDLQKGKIVDIRDVVIGKCCLKDIVHLKAEKDIVAKGFREVFMNKECYKVKNNSFALENDEAGPFICACMIKCGCLTEKSIQYDLTLLDEGIILKGIADCLMYLYGKVRRPSECICIHKTELEPAITMETIANFSNMFEDRVLKFIKNPYIAHAFYRLKFEALYSLLKTFFEEEKDFLYEKGKSIKLLISTDDALVPEVEKIKI